MQTQNRLLEDLARVASSAMGVAANMRGEVEARLREQFERIAGKAVVLAGKLYHRVAAFPLMAAVSTPPFHTPILYQFRDMEYAGNINTRCSVPVSIL